MINVDIKLDSQTARIREHYSRINANSNAMRMPLVSCSCNDVSFGTYDAQVLVALPNGNWIGVDACLVPILKWLWTKGVDTVVSCCGHGKISPSIVVTDGSVPFMNKMGFIEIHRNTCGNEFEMPTVTPLE